MNGNVKNKLNFTVQDSYTAHIHTTFMVNPEIWLRIGTVVLMQTFSTYTAFDLIVWRLELSWM